MAHSAAFPVRPCQYASINCQEWLKNRWDNLNWAHIKTITSCYLCMLKSFLVHLPIPVLAPFPVLYKIISWFVEKKIKVNWPFQSDCIHNEILEGKHKDALPPLTFVWGETLANESHPVCWEAETYSNHNCWKGKLGSSEWASSPDWSLAPQGSILAPLPCWTLLSSSGACHSMQDGGY